MLISNGEKLSPAFCLKTRLWDKKRNGQKVCAVV